MSAVSTITTVDGPPSPADQVALAVVGLEPSSAAQLRATFDGMLGQIEKWEASAKLINVTSVDQKAEMKMARVSRLALREIRVNVEHERKRLKEDSTRRGKSIDAIANIFKGLIEPLEAHLLEQETFADRAEATRKSALRSTREELLRALGTDPATFANLGETSEETWELTLANARAANEKRIEAAKEAEAVRVEAERIAAENREKARGERVRLEAERVERERLQVEENERVRAQLAKVEEASRAERIAQDERDRLAGIALANERQKTADDAAAKDAAAKAERDTLENETRDAKEIARLAELALEAAKTRLREEKAAAAKEAADREEAEALRVRDRDTAARAAYMAPDREKLAAFASMLLSLEIPTLTTPTGQAAAIKVADQIKKMAAWVAKTGASL